MAENNGKVQKMRRVSWANFKFVCAQIWQTILLLFIAVIFVACFLAALQLGNYTDNISPAIATFIYIVFVVFMQVITLTVWEDILGKISAEYTFQFFAGIIFFLFIIFGLASFVIFMYYTCVFWWGDLLSIRILPPVFGLVNFWWFAKFKVFND